MSEKIGRCPLEPREMALASQSTPQKKVFNWQQLWGGNEDQDSARLARNEVRWDMFSCLLWYFFSPNILPFLTVMAVLSLAVKFYLMPSKPFIYWIHNLLEPSLWRGSSEGFKALHKQFIKSKNASTGNAGTPQNFLASVLPCFSPVLPLPYSVAQQHAQECFPVSRRTQFTLYACPQSWPLGCWCLCWTLHHLAAFPLGIHDATLTLKGTILSVWKWIVPEVFESCCHIGYSFINYLAEGKPTRHKAVCESCHVHSQHFISGILSVKSAWEPSWWHLLKDRQRRQTTFLLQNRSVTKAWRWLSAFHWVFRSNFVYFSDFCK